MPDLEEEAREHLQALGLEIGASLDDVERAWRELVREFHPDKMGQKGAAVQNVAEATLKRLNNARDWLKANWESLEGCWDSGNQVPPSNAEEDAGEEPREEWEWREEPFERGAESEEPAPDEEARRGEAPLSLAMARGVMAGTALVASAPLAGLMWLVVGVREWTDVICVLWAALAVGSVLILMEWDDEDGVCPVCGEKAGSGKRLSWCGRPWGRKCLFKDCIRGGIINAFVMPLVVATFVGGAWWVVIIFAMLKSIIDPSFSPPFHWSDLGIVFGGIAFFGGIVRGAYWVEKRVAAFAVPEKRSRRQ